MEKKQPCEKCKKKKVVKKLDPIIEDKIEIFTKEDILKAFDELSSYSGPREDKKEYISKVYKFIFNEDFDWTCNSCGHRQARKYKNYVEMIKKVENESR